MLGNISNIYTRLLDSSLIDTTLYLQFIWSYEKKRFKEIKMFRQNQSRGPQRIEKHRSIFPIYRAGVCKRFTFSDAVESRAGCFILAANFNSSGHRRPTEESLIRSTVQSIVRSSNLTLPRRKCLKWHCVACKRYVSFIKTTKLIVQFYCFNTPVTVEPVVLQLLERHGYSRQKLTRRSLLGQNRTNV